MVIFLHRARCKAVKTAFLLLSGLLIQSCASLPELTNNKPDNWGSLVAEKNIISTWKINGRLGLQTEDNGGTFDLFWNRNDDEYDIRLIAPLGQGAFYIKGNSESVNVRSTNGETHSSDNPQQLFKEQLGVELPLSSLRSWILGVPSKHLPITSTSWDSEGQIQLLKQAEWKIEMSRYKPVNQYRMPHFFILQKDDRPDLVIRIIVRKWTAQK